MYGTNTTHAASSGGRIRPKDFDTIKTTDAPLKLKPLQKSDPRLMATEAPIFGTTKKASEPPDARFHEGRATDGHP